MQDVSVKYHGLITYWNPQDCKRGALQSILKNASMLDIYREPSTLATLRVACDDMATRKQIVRPLAKNRGWCVQDETRGDYSNFYNQDGAVTLDKDGIGYTIDGNIDPIRFCERMAWHRERIPKGTLGSILAKAVQRLSGIALRPAGGVYWIPQVSIDRWRSVINPLEAEGTKGYKFVHELDTDALVAVHDAVRSELQYKLSVIDSELANGFGRASSYEERQARAEDLLEKIRTYESILNCNLSDLTAKAHSAEEMAAAAALLAMAKQGGEHVAA